MKVLVVSQYYYPEPFRVHEICEELRKRGHDVTVLTEYPNYPDGEIYEGYSYKNEIELINGVNVIRCKARPRHKGNINLALNYISFVYSGGKKIKKIEGKFDIIYVYQLSPVTMVLPAIYYKRKRKIPLYIYCLDLWPESVKSNLGGTYSPLFQLVKIVSKKIYNKADLIGVTSKPFFEYLSNICKVCDEKMVYLPQHADDLLLDNDLTTVNDNCIDFMFMGNIGQTQDLDNVIDAVDIIRNLEGFKVHIVGSGSYLDTLQQHVNEKKLGEKVIFHGRHPFADMPRFYQLADVCLLTMVADSAVGLTIPGKLQGYMSAGKPILGAINGASVDVINESNCGVCVRAGDSQALAKAMKGFIDKPDTFVQMGQNGRSYYLEHFSTKKHIDMLEKQFALCIEQHTRRKEKY